MEFTLSFPREDLLRKTIKLRKIKDINTNRLDKEFGESIEQSDDPNILAQNIERSMEKLLEEHAPERIKWSPSEITTLGSIMR